MNTGPADFRLLPPPPGAPPDRWQLLDPAGQPLAQVPAFLHRVGLRGLAAGTLRTYAHDLWCAHRWWHGRGLAPPSLTETDLLDFIAHQRDHLHAAPTTINRRLLTLARYAAFCRGETVTAWPAGRRERRRRAPRLRVRVPQAVIEPLSSDQLQRFFRSLRRARDRAIVGLMWSAGLRAVEVLRLRVDDVRWSTRQLRVHGKGNKPRVLPLAEPLAQWIARYLQVERPDSAVPALFLVLKGPRRGQPLTYAGLRAVFRYHRRRSQVRGAHPHRFRHCFGAALAQAGVSVPVLMQLLGHASAQTAMQYAQLSDEQLRQQYLRALSELHLPPPPP